MRSPAQRETVSRRLVPVGQRDTAFFGLMKIVHVEDHFLPTSGYQINFLTKWHVRHGHKAVIVTSRSLRPWAGNGFVSEAMLSNMAAFDDEFCSRTGVNVIRLPTLGSYSSRQFFYPGLFKTVRELRPDVVLAHGNDTLTGMRFILRAGKLPYAIVLDNHMAEVASVNRFNRLFRWMYRCFITPRIRRHDLTVIALAKDVQDYCVRNYAIPREQMPIVSWGVDTMLFHPDRTKRSAFRRHHSIMDNGFVVIYTGKITPDKKVDLLAQAMEKEFSGPRKVVLVLVGSGGGDYFNEVKTILDRSANRVLLFPTQQVTDLAQFYQAADLAVWPGACSLSFFDAQSCGLPVIAEAIEPNKVRINDVRANGWLYQIDDTAALRQALEKCVAMEPLAFNQIASNAQEYVTKNFSYDIVASQVEDIMLNRIKLWREARIPLIA